MSGSVGRSLGKEVSTLLHFINIIMILYISLGFNPFQIVFVFLHIICLLYIVAILYLILVPKIYAI